MSNVQRITIPSPCDFHAHMRGGPERISNPVTIEALRAANRAFSYVTVMPNTNPPILTANDALSYKAVLETALEPIQKEHHNTLGKPKAVELLMTIEIRPTTTRKMIRDAKKAGITAGKIYPKAVTTNSDGGVTDFSVLAEVLKACEDGDFLVLIHGEKPDMNGDETYETERETQFIHETLPWILETFPDLRVVLEHISTEKAVKAVNDYWKSYRQTLAASITPHHLHLTLNNVLSGGLRPDNYCMPIAKHFDDRKALQEAILGRENQAILRLSPPVLPNFFLGTDSAPHEKMKKYAQCGCAGVFSGPTALETVLKLFDDQDLLNDTMALHQFVSSNGRHFYRIPNEEDNWHAVFERRPWVPRVIHHLIDKMGSAQEVHAFTPFLCDQTLQWQLTGWEKIS